MDDTAHHFDVGELAGKFIEFGFDDHQRHRSVGGNGQINFLSFAVDAFFTDRIGRRCDNFQKIQERSDSIIQDGASAHHRNHACAADAEFQSLADVVFAQRAFVEIFFNQIIGAFGRQFDHLFAHFGDQILHFFGNG